MKIKFVVKRVIHKSVDKIKKYIQDEENTDDTVEKKKEKKKRSTFPQQLLSFSFLNSTCSPPKTVGNSALHFLFLVRDLSPTKKTPCGVCGVVSVISMMQFRVQKLEMGIQDIISGLFEPDVKTSMKIACPFRVDLRCFGGLGGLGIFLLNLF